MQNQLKGLIAQDLWNSSAYYQVTNEQNPIYVKALQSFSDGSFPRYNIQTSDTKGIKIKEPVKEKNKEKRVMKDKNNTEK